MPSNFLLLKKAAITFLFFYVRFYLVTHIRNLRINLRNELLYLYIFITYMRPPPLVNTSLFTMKLEFCPNSLGLAPESQRPKNKVEITKMLQRKERGIVEAMDPLYT